MLSDKQSCPNCKPEFASLFLAPSQKDENGKQLTLICCISCGWYDEYVPESGEHEQVRSEV